MNGAGKKYIIEKTNYQHSVLIHSKVVQVEVQPQSWSLRIRTLSSAFVAGIAAAAAAESHDQCAAAARHGLQHETVEMENLHKPYPSI